MKNIVIVDYGMGNIESVSNAFKYLNASCKVTNKISDIAQATAIVMPGVGAFYRAMENLRSLDLIETLDYQVKELKKPFLGICLGMQLISQDSTELKYTKGLGWIDGHVVQIEIKPPNSIPHVGWNNVNFIHSSPLFQGIDKESHFFFDHSYQLSCPSRCVVATCDYEKKMIVSIQKDNIFAVQFHPEKSQRNGLKLLRNFLNLIEGEC